MHGGLYIIFREELQIFNSKHGSPGVPQVLIMYQENILKPSSSAPPSPSFLLLEYDGVNFGGGDGGDHHGIFENLGFQRWGYVAIGVMKEMEIYTLLVGPPQTKANQRLLVATAGYQLRSSDNWTVCWGLRSYIYTCKYTSKDPQSLDCCATCAVEGPQRYHAILRESATELIRDKLTVDIRATAQSFQQLLSAVSSF